MIKLIVLLFPCLLYSFNYKDSVTVEVNSDRFVKIVNNLDSLIQITEIENEHVKSINAHAIDRFKNDEIGLLSGQYLESDIFGGAAFDFGNEKIGPYLAFNEYILDIYSGQPSIVYSILISLYQHIYSYYNNNELFMIAEDNRLEKYFFKMDALYIEAMFIRDYLKPNEFKLTNYEEYLLNSLNNDGLSSASAFFKSIELDLSHKMNDIAGKDITLDEALKLFRAIGNQIITEFEIDPEKSDWENYNAILPLNTFNEFAKQVLYDIAIRKDERVNSIEEMNLNYYPLEKELLFKVESLLNEHIQLLEYASGLLKQFKNIN